MATDSNVNLNNQLIGGNTGLVNSVPLGVPRTFVLVPLGTVIPAAQMIDQATFATYAYAQFINDTESLRWRAFTRLDTFKDDTKKPTVEDTGIYQLGVYKFGPKHSFRYLCGFANFVEALKFHDTKRYDFFYIDDQGNWRGTKDLTGAGGLKSYTLLQLFIEDMGMHETTHDNMFGFTVSASDRKEFNENIKVYAANFNADSIPMLQNAICTDVSATLGTPLTITTTTDIVIMMKGGQDSVDLIQKYQAALTVACFKATNLTTGATLTITSMTFGLIVVAGQAYYYGWAILSAAPTATHKVQLTLRPPSVVNPIAPNFNSVVEIINANTNGDGGNAAVHTF